MVTLVTFIRKVPVLNPKSCAWFSLVPTDKSLYASLLFKHGSFLPRGFQFITLVSVEVVSYSETV